MWHWLTVSTCHFFLSRNLQLEEDSGTAREAEARAVQLRREQVHKAALDNMAGETVSALFKSMAKRDKEKNKSTNNSRENKEGGGGSRGGGGGSGEGSTEGQVTQGAHPAQGASEHTERPGNQRSGNQDGEEDYGPGRGGVRGSNNQQADEKEQRRDGKTEEGLAHGSSSERIATIPAVAAVPPRGQAELL